MAWPCFGSPIVPMDYRRNPPYRNQWIGWLPHGTKLSLLETMKLRSRFTLPIGLLFLAAATFACSGGDGEDPTATAAAVTPTTVASEASPTPVEATSPGTATPPPATATPEPAATPTVTPQPGSLAALSLVYVDTRRGQGGDIYVADADGSNPRMVLNEPGFSRPLDLHQSLLAAVTKTGISFVDLASNDVPWALPLTEAISSGRFFDDGVFLYTTGSGCPLNPGGVLTRYEVGSKSTPIVTTDTGLMIVGTDVNTNSVAVVPRGCDVGIDGIDVYDALTGNLRNSLDVQGCGWAIAALDQAKAITSWLSCTPPANHADADATVYDFGIVGPTDRDITVPVVDSNAMLWIRRPGHADVAFGTTTSLGAGPGGTRSGGIYTLSLANRTFAIIVDGEGAEQYPIAWSPDGRYLLYATVEAQGVCHFAYLDTSTANAQPVPINPDITFCGVNGTVVGWTELP